MASNDLWESKMTSMDHVMELIFTKVVPCPGVGILKMIPYSAARPRTEKHMKYNSCGLGLSYTRCHKVCRILKGAAIPWGLLTAW